MRGEKGLLKLIRWQDLLVLNGTSPRYLNWAKELPVRHNKNLKKKMMSASATVSAVTVGGDWNF